MKLLVFVSLAVSNLTGLSAIASEEKVDYVRDVKSLFKSRCYACHGALKQEGGLRLDTVADAIKGGESGRAIKEGDPKSSYLIERIADSDESSRMPQEGSPLSAEEIAKIKKWIEQGAKAPTNDAPEPDPRDHWAFKRIVRPSVPNLNSSQGQSKFNVQNQIDSFIASEYQKRELQPVGEADKATLLRRVYLDLIGLPPSRGELYAFLADESPDAYEKLVDRLLASPQYGERWGRHWMDVWRYSDWYGRRKASDVTNSYPMIWRWRDWIVNSLNEDKGYDRMVVEMLAADEVTPEEDENIVATGFLVRNYFRWNYNQWMKDNVEHTAKAFLGLTLNCAHCHDHKYDPISQEEYFAFRAFFEPLELRHDRVPHSPDPGPYKKYVYLEKWPPIKSGMVRVFDEKMNAETRMYSRGDERNVMEDKPAVAPRVPAILGVDQPPIEPINLPLVTVYPGLKPFIELQELIGAKRAISDAEKAVTAAKTNLKATESAFAAEVEAAGAKWNTNPLESNSSDALIGKYSLFLDATKGRRALGNHVEGLGEVVNGTTISFQILLVRDGHAGFQLALNTATGATATYLAFQNGRILTYRPHTYETIEIGRYDWSAGQKGFHVSAVLDRDRDQLTLSVKELNGDRMFVDRTSAALHGWNPTRGSKQGIIFDARPGTIVALDEIVLSQPGANSAIRFGFEEPQYSVDRDVIGHEGWMELPFCIAPASSIVGKQVGISESAAAAQQRLATSGRRLDALRLQLPVAEAALEATHKEMSSVQARIAAGKAKFLNSGNAVQLAREASRAERIAVHAKAVAQERAGEMALTEIEGNPGNEKDRNASKKKYEKAREKVVAAAKALEAESEAFTTITPTYPAQSTGRRTALSRAIVDRNNPLTARVAVNHIWMWHFGKPLVESVFDFGRNGKSPSHPALLDWLAAEFMDSNWSMKHLHRLIVTSATYRLSSAAMPDSPSSKIDADNQFLWRFARQRMQAEVVRDSILYSAGRLNLIQGGPELERAEADKTRRRSLYISHHGEGRAALMETFNAANPTECYRRIETVVPQQALAIVNDVMTLEASRALAHKLWEQILAAVPAKQDRERAFIDAAYEQLLTRLPKPQERDASLDFLKRQIKVYQSARSTRESLGDAEENRPSDNPEMRARESLVHALYSHHDFISVR